jgi:hypothetical protein
MGLVIVIFLCLGTSITIMAGSNIIRHEYYNGDFNPTAVDFNERLYISYVSVENELNTDSLGEIQIFALQNSTLYNIFRIPKDPNNNSRINHKMIGYNNELYMFWLQSWVEHGERNLVYAKIPGDGEDFEILNLSKFADSYGFDIVVFNEKLFVFWADDNELFMKYLDKTTWSNTVKIFSSYTGMVLYPELAIYDNKLIVAWYDEVIYIKTYDEDHFSVSTIISEDVKSEDERSCKCILPKLVVHNNELFVFWVTMRLGPGWTYRELCYKIFNGSHWSENILIDRINWYWDFDVVDFNDELYLVYDWSPYLTFKRYDQGNWTNLTTPGGYDNPKLIVHDNELYIELNKIDLHYYRYRQFESFGTVEVKRFTGSGWQSISWVYNLTTLENLDSIDGQNNDNGKNNDQIISSVDSKFFVYFILLSILVVLLIILYWRKNRMRK